MSWQTFWLFVTVTFLVSATPGPNMLLVMSSSARFGFGASVATMTGCLTALLAMMSISAAGLGALLQAFPSVFNGLRWLGAAYLVYLGVKTWRAPPHDGSVAAARALRRSGTSAALFRQGLLVAASNPKAILFAAAFLPQFIHPQLPKLPQFAILLATFAVIEISWYVIYAASGQRLAAYLHRAEIMTAFNRLTGGVFVGFAAIIAVAHE
jgi:threonine/homoserine/homoserine lactone efflux protein